MSGSLNKPSSVKNSEYKEEDESDGDEYYEEGGGRLLHPTGHRLYISSHGRYRPGGGGGDGVNTDGPGLLIKDFTHLTFTLRYGILGRALVHTGSELHALVAEILSMSVKCHSPFCQRSCSFVLHYLFICIS